ncbi:MAG: type I restriction enzyme HsdR N-terminal domain-containing protein [Armatimonadetes bacterium]|nr:type I restriction enzyme HsdR N-terminal domain-containing protein [Armatimonadota bacterium]
MPDLIDELRSIAAKIEKSRQLVTTEEATKNAFVMPFISALGYDVFDPTEVTPELTADVGVKKGEKIDYAILRESKPIMLFECKHHTANLAQEHASQLYRYFSVTECRVAILTNGIEYRLFSDLDAPNKMDAKPFLVFNILDFSDALIPELKKFSKDSFNIDALLSSANELKYTREIKTLLAQQLVTPSEDFVRFCANGIGVPRMTQAVKDQFSQLTRKALSEFLSESMGEKLKSALGTSVGNVGFETKVAKEFVEAESRQERDPEIVTTEEELEGYYVVKAILRDVVDVRRIVHRDQKSYFGILLDDNNRKPICRLHFNAVSKKYISFFDQDHNEDKVQISSIDDIYIHAERLRATALSY